MSVRCRASRRVSVPRPRQQGLALLVAMLLLVFVGLSLFVSKLTAGVADATRREKTSEALNEARQALVAYAVTYPDRFLGQGPGRLPCPDADGDGNADAPCGPNAIGRLPWVTLGTADLVDANGERLWYAVSDNFRASAPAVPLNSSTPGQLSLDAVGDKAAIIIAPGASLNGQARNLAPGATANYMETDNADGDTSFVSVDAGDFNDQLVAISRVDLMQSVERRVARDIVLALRRYYNNRGYFPFAARVGTSAAQQYGVNNLRQGFLPLAVPGGAAVNPSLDPVVDTLPAWVVPNQWDQLTYYAVADGCTSANMNCGGAGRLRVGNLTTVLAMTALAGSAISNTNCAGAALANQVRPSASVCDYLDDAENTDGDDVFSATNLRVASIYNDRIAVTLP